MESRKLGNVRLAAAAAAAAAIIVSDGTLEERVKIDQPRSPRYRPTPSASSYTHWRGSRYTPNSRRETARRRSQIGAGRLTRANGLVA